MSQEERSQDEQSTQTKPKFKMGDRVRFLGYEKDICGQYGNFQRGGIYTVNQIGRNDVGDSPNSAIQTCEEEWWVGVDCFELADESSEPKEESESPGQAKRYNKGKRRWRNFPMFLLRPLIDVAQYGEGKYAMFNFLKGAPVNQYLDCMKRHLDKFEDPSLPDEDDESKVSHMGHIAWNALVCAWILKNRPDLDDRYKPD